MIENYNEICVMFRIHLREALKASGMTQKALAEKTGITEVSISRYLNGQRIPRGPQIVVLAKALNVTCDYLLSLKSMVWLD